jgi:adenosylcobinamide amidohydrolase
MSIRVEWDNEARTIVHYSFLGGWTWDELYQSIEVGENMAKDSTARVHAILDMREGNGLPGGSFLTPAARNHAQNLANRMHPERGHIMVVGASPIMRSMYLMFRSLFGDKAGGVEFVQTIEEARAALGKLPVTPVTKADTPAPSTTGGSKPSGYVK